MSYGIKVLLGDYGKVRINDRYYKIPNREYWFYETGELKPDSVAWEDFSNKYYANLDYFQPYECDSKGNFLYPELAKITEEARIAKKTTKEEEETTTAAQRIKDLEERIAQGDIDLDETKWEKWWRENKDFVKKAGIALPIIGYFMWSKIK